MKALLLNSGMGKRMGELVSKHPKCMTEIKEGDTILSRQLKFLHKCGVTDIVMTTGFYNNVLVDYCNSLKLPIDYTFVINPVYAETNYIYSIYLARQHLNDNIVLMHGDLVFAFEVLEDMLRQNNSCVTVSSTIALPQKDFKAVIKDGLVEKIGIEFFDNAVAAQPLYKICKDDWKIWLDRIILYCEKGQADCYAEDAFNEVSDKCHMYPLDFKNRLCAEIDTPQDLASICQKLRLKEEQF